MAVIYIVGAVVAGIVGYKVVTWDPLKAVKDARAVADAKKLAEADAKLTETTTALQSAQAQVQQTQAAIATTTKQQTQVGQTWVAATGQVLAAAPPEIREERHVAAAIKSNAQAAQALEQAIGQLTPQQLEIVVRYVAEATSAVEAKRAEADAMLHQTQAQLDEMRRQKAGEEEEKKTAQSQLAAALKQYEQARQANRATLNTFQAALNENGGLAGLLETGFFWLKLAGLLYVLVAYVLPLLAHSFPGLEPLANLAHAALAPLAAKAKREAEALARDASAATHVVLAKVAKKAPWLLAEASNEAKEWLSEADGMKARYESKLREANLI